MFTYEEFKTELVKKIEEYLGEDGRVEFAINKKNNDTDLNAILLRGIDNKITPCIYTEVMYEDYKNGMSIEEIMDIIKIVFEERGAVYVEDIFEKWEVAKDTITLAVINREWNDNLLQKLCHREFLDLAIICKCILHENEQGRASCNVTYNMLEQWNITEDELWETAFDNFKTESFYIKDLSEMMKCISGDENECECNYCMYVLSNQNNKDGAKVILREEYFETLSLKLDADLYLLPSSLHEIICVPVTDDIHVELLKEMVTKVNETQVLPEDRLNNQVYLYSRETREIRIA